MSPTVELYPCPREARICVLVGPAAATGRRAAGPPRLGRGRALALAVLLGPAAALHARGAAAQVPAAAAQAEVAPAPRESAKEHFEAGLQQYRARHYREAIRELELSVARLPSAEVWFDIARAHEQLGEYELAAQSYRRYLRDRVDAPDARRIAQRIEELKRRAAASRSATRQGAGPSAALAIDADLPGTLLLLDGRPLGTAPIDRIIDVAPGRHRLDARRDGYLPFRAEVEVPPRGLSAAYVDMQPATRFRSAAHRRPWTWIAGSAGAAALLAAGAFGIAALSERADGDARSARHWAVASDVALGGALGLAVAATILYFGEARHTERVGVRPRAGATPP